jgi:hypothetical protein
VVFIRTEEVHLPTREEVPISQIPETRPKTKARDRFLRVAPKRTQKARDALRLLGRCSNRAIYRYDTEEILKIISAIESELERTKVRFDNYQPTAFEL